MSEVSESNPDYSYHILIYRNFTVAYKGETE